MKIQVTGSQEPPVRITLPTALVLNALTARLMGLHIKDREVPLTGAQLSSIFRELRAYSHRHPEWVFVEVESADGTHVRITI